MNVEGDTIAGDMYTLTCTVLVTEGVVDSAILLTTWTHSDGSLVTAEDTNTSVSDSSGTETTLILRFSPLHTSHGGQYFCKASLEISEIALVVNGTYAVDVSAKSKFLVT